MNYQISEKLSFWIFDITLVSFILWSVLMLMEILWPGIVTIVIDPNIFLLLFFVGVISQLTVTITVPALQTWQKRYLAVTLLVLTWLLWRLYSGQERFDLLVLACLILLIGLFLAVIMILYDRGRNR